MIRGNDTVVILREGYLGEVDKYGNAITSKQNIAVKGVLIGWGATTDTLTTISETITNAATLYFPKDVALKENDKFKFSDGSVWLMNGSPILWHPPVGFRVKTKQIVEVTRKEG
jgi:hypothetical protein